jgi:stress response protein SCP2
LQELQPGQNTALAQSRFTAALSWAPASTPLVLDASAYLLGASGKVASDAGFLFYGQASVADGAASLDASSVTFTIDLARMPAGIERVALALTIEQGTRRGQKFNQLTGLKLSLTGDPQPIAFDLDTQAMQEAAVILGEFYLRNGAWKFRAVGQGFHGGLGPLASHFGVEISDDPDQAAPAVAPVAAPPPPAPPPLSIRNTGGDGEVRPIRRRRAPPSHPRPAPLPLPIPAHGQPNMFYLRPADGVCRGFNQDSVVYQDGWAAEEREHGGLRRCSRDSRQPSYVINTLPSDPDTVRSTAADPGTVSARPAALRSRHTLR